VYANLIIIHVMSGGPCATGDFAFRSKCELIMARGIVSINRFLHELSLHLSPHSRLGHQESTQAVVGPPSPTPFSPPTSAATRVSTSAANSAPENKERAQAVEAGMHACRLYF
jgi:hypothetical protein